MSVEVQLPVMGAQGAKLEEPAAGNNNVNNVAVLSLEMSSTTMSDGGGAGGAPGLSPHRRSSYVRQLKACILQKRQKVEPSTEGISIVSPSTEMEDESSSYHDAGLGGMHHHNMSTSINNIQHHQHHNNMSSNVNQQQVHHHQVTVAKQSNIKTTTAAPFFAWPIVTEGTTALAADAAAAPGRARGPCRQFWKAGEYDGQPSITTQQSGGIDHVRVHPKFLHSNATSHKWALGAIAEILDNSMDEVKNGATFVNVDMIKDPRDGSPMLYIEDNGGGMTPERMRECMSLGYSTKSKSGNTIDGNGFKTSTMRLGADVIVFSRSPADIGRRATQSIGVLSFTFLRTTGHDDIVVPMVDYELKEGKICPLIRSTTTDWAHNLQTIQQWSPYSSEHDLFNQFFGMTEKGTKVIIYNLWEDDQGQVELDFDSDCFDIQVRGAAQDEKRIMMAQRYTYSKHYLTYQHSLRSYASILYFRLPPGFRIILRGQDIQHHNLVEDLMFTQELSYKPQGFESSKDVKMVATVTLGFVKDAKEHVDVQGFNVYHKNRLIKPFWKVWNTAGSDGRGVIGVLEANFVEPAHDKQSFERTAVLSRLELRLLQMQKIYWANNCHLVGYVNKKLNRKNSRQSASGLDYNTCSGQVEANVCVRPEPHLETAQLQTSGFSVNGARVDMSSPPLDMAFHLVYRNRSNPKPSPVFDMSYEVDRSGSPTPEVSNAYQGPESDTRETTCASRSLEELVRNSGNVGFSTQLVPLNNPLPDKLVLRREATEQETIRGRLTPMNGQGQPFNSEITRELEENKQLRDRLRRLEQTEERTLNFEVDRNRKLEAQLLDMEQQEAVDRRCLEQFLRERDNLRAALDQERRLHENDDEDMRKKLKVALLRIRELESENNRLRLPRG